MTTQFPTGVVGGKATGAALTEPVTLQVRVARAPYFSGNSDSSLGLLSHLWLIQTVWATVTLFHI